MKNIICDFDGTIADVLDPGVEIINQISKKFNFKKKITKKLVRSFTLAQIVEELKISRLKLFFILIEAKKELNKVMNQVQPFPGMRETIEELSKTHNLYIMSSNSRENIMIFLENHKMVPYFKCVVTSPFVFQKHRKINQLIKSESLDRNDCIYVGDEKRDILAAKKSRIKVAIVTWGFDDEKISAEAKPDSLIRHPKELLKLV